VVAILRALPRANATGERGRVMRSSRQTLEKTCDHFGRVQAIGDNRAGESLLMEQPLESAFFTKSPGWMVDKFRDGLLRAGGAFLSELTRAFLATPSTRAIPWEPI
jgi:hypothetical protein